MRGRTLGTTHSQREYPSLIKEIWWASAHVGKLLLVNVMHFYVIQLIFDHSQGKNMTQGQTLGTTHSHWEYPSPIKKSWWASAHVGKLSLVNVMYFYVIQLIFDHSRGKNVMQGRTLRTTHSQWEYPSLIKENWWASAHVGKLSLVNVTYFYVIQLIFDHSRGKNVMQGRTLGTTHSRWEYSILIKFFFMGLGTCLGTVTCWCYALLCNSMNCWWFLRPQDNSGLDPRDHTLSMGIFQSGQNFLMGLWTSWGTVTC